MSARVIQYGQGTRYQQGRSDPLDGSVALRKPGLGARPQANEAAAKTCKSINEYTFRAQAINYDSSRKKQCRKTERI